MSFRGRQDEQVPDERWRSVYCIQLELVQTQSIVVEYESKDSKRGDIIHRPSDGPKCTQVQKICTHVYTVNGNDTHLTTQMLLDSKS